jgi:hypothetical protein
MSPTVRSKAAAMTAKPREHVTQATSVRLDESCLIVFRTVYVSEVSPRFAALKMRNEAMIRENAPKVRTLEPWATSTVSAKLLRLYSN